MDSPPQPGAVQHPEPGLRLVLAPNPSPMTHWGTNTYLLGEGEVAVIDPGPTEPRHLEVLLAALRPGERVTHIFVTHAHLDHSPLARPLAQATGAPVLAFGDATSGRSARMIGLAGLASLGGSEGLDHTFRPDTTLADGDRIDGPGWNLTALHTPGHLGGHLCFDWDGRLFTGDHIMGWAPSLVSPPEGDMTDYMASLHHIASRHWQRGYPAHGATIPDLSARARDLIRHRRSRESAILAALAEEQDLDQLLHQVYADTEAVLLPAARRNLVAHLIDLISDRRVLTSNADILKARFHREPPH